MREKSTTTTSGTTRTEDSLEGALKRKARGGRISCEKAFEVAEELDVPLRKVGKTLDRLEIKIVRCQLGCFN